MKSGKLRHSVTIQQKGTATYDSHGQPIFSWVTFATAFMEVRGLSSREVFNFGQRYADVNAVMEGHYIAGVTVQMRAVDVCCSRTFDIKEASDLKGVRKVLRLVCKEILP